MAFAPTPNVPLGTMQMISSCPQLVRRIQVPRRVNGLAGAAFAVRHEVPVGGGHQGGVIVPEGLRDRNDALASCQQHGGVVVAQGNGWWCQWVAPWLVSPPSLAFLLASLIVAFAFVTRRAVALQAVALSA
jgi:hypothetical protein